MTVRGTLSNSIKLHVFGNPGKDTNNNYGSGEVITYRLSEEELQKYRSLPKPERKSS